MPHPACILPEPYRPPSHELRRTSPPTREQIERARAMYLEKFTVSRITGRLFRRDRTTAAYACQLVEDLRDDPALDRLLQTLEDLCDDLARGILSRPQVRP